MTNTDSQVFCSGCNLVVAPNAPGAFDSAKGYGRVHGKVCENKAAKALQRRQAVMESLDRTFYQMRLGMDHLLRKANFGGKAPQGIPMEFTATPAKYGTYSAEEYAKLLSTGLALLYTACQNGKSHLRPEIISFAAMAAKTLGHRVRVDDSATGGTVVQAVPVTNNRVERFRQRASKARTTGKPATKGPRKKR